MLNIAGAVCLLLWGLRHIRNGVTRAFGADLHTAVSAGTGNRFMAFIAGVVITILLQSSTATALIIAAFCGKGILTVTAGLGVMLGADVGTTIVAKILSLDLSWLAPLLIIGGYILFNVYNAGGKGRHLGKLAIGLGLMLFALAWIRQTSAPLNDSDALAVVLQALEKDMIMAVLIAAALTWLMHSSLAFVLLLMTLTASKVLSPELGLVMVLGANLGGAIAPITATLRDSAEAARVPVGNLVMRLIAVLAAAPFLAYITDFIAPYSAGPGPLLVNFHVAFNLGLALVFLPLTGLIARLCVRIIPDKETKDDPGRPRFLDEIQLESPAIALSSAMRETLRMADIVETMMGDTIHVMENNDEALARAIRKRDDTLDSLYKHIKLYMAKITHESLDPDEADQYVRILNFATNLENVGDIIDKSVMEMAQKKIHDRVHFSEEGWQEIQNIHAFTMETIRQAHSVFVSEDPKVARRLIEGKDWMRNAETTATRTHLNRIREGIPETIATSSLHLDLIRDYRRINSYMATVAYPILEDAGQLYKKRLKPTDKT